VVSLESTAESNEQVAGEGGEREMEGGGKVNMDMDCHRLKSRHIILQDCVSQFDCLRSPAIRAHKMYTV
jgi:hypothetical protein